MQYFSKIISDRASGPRYIIHVVDGSGSMSYRSRYENAVALVMAIGTDKDTVVHYAFGNRSINYDLEFPGEGTDIALAFEELIKVVRKAPADVLLDIFFHSDGEHNHGDLNPRLETALTRISEALSEKQGARIHIIGYGNDFPTELCLQIKSIETVPTVHVLFKIEDSSTELPVDAIRGMLKSQMDVSSARVKNLFMEPLRSAHDGSIVIVDSSSVADSGFLSSASIDEIVQALLVASKTVMRKVLVDGSDDSMEGFDAVLSMAMALINSPDSEAVTVRDHFGRKNERMILRTIESIRNSIAKAADTNRRGKVLRGRDLADLLKFESSSRHRDDASARQGVLSSWNDLLRQYRSGVSETFCEQDSAIVSSISLEGWWDMHDLIRKENILEDDLFTLIGVGIPVFMSPVPDFAKQQAFGMQGSKQIRHLSEGIIKYMDVCNLRSRQTSSASEGVRLGEQESEINRVILVGEKQHQRLFLSGIMKMLTTAHSIELPGSIDPNAHFAQLSCFALFLIGQKPMTARHREMLDHATTTMRFYKDRMLMSGEVVTNETVHNYIKMLREDPRKAMHFTACSSSDISAWTETLLKPAGYLLAHDFTREKARAVLKEMALSWVSRLWQGTKDYSHWFALTGVDTSSTPTLETLGLSGTKINELALLYSEVDKIVRTRLEDNFVAPDGQVSDDAALGLEIRQPLSVIEQGHYTRIALPWKDFTALCEHFEAVDVIDEMRDNILPWFIHATTGKLQFSGFARAKKKKDIISNLLQKLQSNAFQVCYDNLLQEAKKLWADNHRLTHTDSLRATGDGVYPLTRAEFDAYVEKHNLEGAVYDPETGYCRNVCMYCHCVIPRMHLFPHMRGPDGQGCQSRAFCSDTVTEAFSRSLTQFACTDVPKTADSFRMFLKESYSSCVREVTADYRPYLADDLRDDEIDKHVAFAVAAHT